MEILTPTLLENAFLQILRERERGGMLHFMRSSLSERSVFQIIFDLYAAGSETSSTALQWIILYLIKYPVVQTKCIFEIKKVSYRNE